MALSGAAQPILPASGNSLALAAARPGSGKVAAEAEAARHENARPTVARAIRLKVTRHDILSMTTQLAIMARAGVDLGTAVHALARQARSRNLKKLLEQIHQDIQQGLPISESLRRYSHIVGESYVATLAAGEASGRLSEVLSQLTDLQRNEVRLRATLRGLLGYPIVLTAVCLAVLACLTFFVLPRFAEIFQESEVPLPWITQVLIASATELKARFWLWGLLAAAIIAGAIWYARTPGGKRLWDRMLINGKLWREVTRALIVGRVFRLLGLMIESGVPILESLRLARYSTSNLVFRRVFQTLEEDVLNGRSMGSCLSREEAVPAGAAEMMTTAERTGKLGPVASLIGQHLEEQGETRLRALVSLLEPAIIIVMGVVVALVVLAVMLPMFDLATLSGGK